ncbi:MAG: hypothetical protein QW088_07450 [Desulfurococcaceae archaeon]
MGEVKKEVCPRCGLPGSSYVKTVRGREYVYFYHWIKGERRVKMCYLGPRDEYVHVERVHSISYGDGYGLTNVMENDLIAVADQSLTAFERLVHRMRVEALRDSLRKLSELRSHLDEVIKLVEERIRVEEMKDVDVVKELRKHA